MGSQINDFVQDSVKTWIRNNNAEEELELMCLYKELIHDLQDVMDFYSLLTGVSIWKGRHDSRNIDQYHCQLNSALACGNYRFVMKINYDEGEVRYCPCDVEMETLKAHLPKSLADPSSFSCNQAFVFLRDMLGNVGELP